MIYEEWKKEVDKKHGDGTFDKMRKMHINEKTDREQYKKYIDVLGKGNMPETFDKFQLLKYNNTNEWKELKSDYRYKILLNDREFVYYSDSIRSLPIIGKANSITDFIMPDGTVKQRRLYGPNQKPYKDIDTDDHQRPKYHPMGAHKHSFDYTLKNPHQKADYFTERELRQNSDIIKEGENYHDDR